MAAEKTGKKKKSLYLYAITVILLFLGIVVLSMALLFHVNSITIVGNDYIEDQELIGWVEEYEYSDNSLFLLWKFHHEEQGLLPSVERVDIKLKAPWAVEVHVEEKRPVGYLIDEMEYVYFDKEGMVLFKTSEILENIPCIEGIEAEEMKVYEVLPVTDTKVFTSILEVTQLVKKEGIAPDRITCSGKNINLYFGGICAQLGAEQYAERIVQIPPILEKLGDQSGTLHLENFSGLHSTISFQKTEIPPEEEQNPAEEEQIPSEDELIE